MSRPGEITVTSGLHQHTTPDLKFRLEKANDSDKNTASRVPAVLTQKAAAQLSQPAYRKGLGAIRLLCFEVTICQFVRLAQKWK
jgi:hypothetical protein